MRSKVLRCLLLSVLLVSVTEGMKRKSKNDISLAINKTSQELA